MRDAAGRQRGTGARLTRVCDPEPDSGQLQRTVVVAVITVRMMQMTVDQVVDVITVRYRGVSAVRAVHVPGIVPLAVVRRAARGVDIGDLDNMFVVVIVMGAVQMPVMQIAGVVAVFDRNVTALRAVLVGMVLMNGVAHR